MFRNFAVILVTLCMISCAGFHLFPPTEVIAGIQIVSVEEIEGKDGSLRRLVKGTLPTPLANDEDWLVSAYAIYQAKKLPGQGLTIQIYLDTESPCETKR